ADDAAEFLSDLFVLVALDLPQRDGAQLRVPKPVEQATVLVGHLRRQLGLRVAAQQLLQALLLRGRLGPAAAQQVAGLADGGPDQQVPQVLAVQQARELAALCPQAQALEGAQRHVLLVAGQLWLSTQPQPGEPDQSLEVALQEARDGVPPAFLDL